MKVKTSKKNWTICGMNLVPSDEIYQKLVSAIESDNLSQEHLQKITGHYAPISVDTQHRVIIFFNF